MATKAGRIDVNKIKPSKSKGSDKAAPPAVASANMQKSEDKYRAESDARTLAEAAAVQGDPKRMAQARKAAAELLKEHEGKASSLRNIVKKGANNG